MISYYNIIKEDYANIPRGTYTSDLGDNTPSSSPYSPNFSGIVDDIKANPMGYGLGAAGIGLLGAGLMAGYNHFKNKSLQQSAQNQQQAIQPQMQNIPLVADIRPQAISLNTQMQLSNKQGTK